MACRDPPEIEDGGDVRGEIELPGFTDVLQLNPGSPGEEEATIRNSPGLYQPRPVAARPGRSCPFSTTAGPGSWLPAGGEAGTVRPGSVYPGPARLGARLGSASLAIPAPVSAGDSEVWCGWVCVCSWGAKGLRGLNRTCVCGGRVWGCKACGDTQGCGGKEGGELGMLRVPAGVQGTCRKVRAAGCVQRERAQRAGLQTC